MIEKDNLRILSHLRTNARASLLDLSKNINVPHSTIHQRVRDYEGNVIVKHTSLIDYQKVGFFCHCFVLLKVKNELRNNVETSLKEHKNVNNFFRVNSSNDFLVECVFRDLGEQKEFLQLLSTGFETQAEVINIIQSITRESFLTDLNKFQPINLM